MASTYPTSFTYAAQYVQLTGNIAGYLSLGASLGSMIIPALAGKLIETSPKDCMFYKSKNVMHAYFKFILDQFEGEASNLSNFKKSHDVTWNFNYVSILLLNYRNLALYDKLTFLNLLMYCIPSGV